MSSIKTKLKNSSIFCCFQKGVVYSRCLENDFFGPPPPFCVKSQKPHSMPFEMKNQNFKNILGKVLFKDPQTFILLETTLSNMKLYNQDNFV